MLLADTGVLPTDTAALLENLDPQRIVILGGTVAVSEQVAEQLEPSLLS